MKFDMLDAMAHMRKEFGYSGEILLRQSSEGYIVRLSVREDVIYHSEFMVPMIEITDARVNVMNFKFEEALKELKKRMLQLIQ